MVMPFMTLYLTEDLEVSLPKAGFVMALFGAGSICGGLIGGKLSDRFGFYYVQIATLLGGGILFLVLGQMKTYPLICLFSFLLSLVNEAFRPANSAAIAQYSTPNTRTRSYSLNRLAINLGWAVGASLGGFIAARNYEALFWVDGFTNIGAAMLLWMLLAPSKNKSTPRTVAVAVEAGRSAYRDRTYLAFVALTILFAYCFFQLFTNLPVYLKKELRLSEEFIGVIMATNGILIAMFEMVLVFRLEARGRTIGLIPIGVLLAGLSFAVFNILPAGAFVAALSMGIGTLAEMLSMPFMNTFWISRSTEATRGQYAGLYTVAWSTAQVLGPSTGATIADRWGFDGLWWWITALCVIAAAGYHLIARSQRAAALASRPE